MDLTEHQNSQRNLRFLLKNMDRMGYPVHHETSSRQWIPEKRGKDRDGFEWVIPGHWSDDPGYQPKPEKEPVVYMQHKCHIDGAFILVGGYIKIIDGNVEKGKRGHELFLRFGGIGIGGMDGSGVLCNFFKYMG